LVGGLVVGATSVLSTRAADATVSPVRRLDTRTDPAGAVRPKRPRCELRDRLRDLLLRDRAEDERAECLLPLRGAPSARPRLPCPLRRETLFRIPDSRCSTVALPAPVPRAMRRSALVALRPPRERAPLEARPLLREPRDLPRRPLRPLRDLLRPRPFRRAALLVFAGST